MYIQDTAHPRRGNLAWSEWTPRLQGNFPPVEQQQLGQIGSHTGEKRTGYFRRNFFRFLRRQTHELMILILQQKMLIYCPADRMSAKEAVKHKYFDDLNKDTLPAVADWYSLCTLITIIPNFRLSPSYLYINLANLELL